MHKHKWRDVQNAHDAFILRLNLFSVLFSWNTGIFNIAAMEVLSDESIVLCGGECSKLTHHNKQNGQVLYQKRLENWMGGLAEITIGQQQCLALSFEIPEKER